MERFTIQRKLIIDAVTKHGHVTVKDIQNYIDMNDFNMSLATIYRNLDALVEDDVLSRISVNLKDNYYEIANNEPHSHFVCEKCHNIIDISLDEKFQPMEICGHLAKSKSTVYYGICKDCLSKN